MLPALVNSIIEYVEFVVSSKKVSNAVTILEWVCKSIHFEMSSFGLILRAMNSCLKSSWYMMNDDSLRIAFTYQTLNKGYTYNGLATKDSLIEL